MAEQMKIVYTKDAAFRKLQFPSKLQTKTNNRPAAGPYVHLSIPQSNQLLWLDLQSQAIATSSTIYCSGQIPCDPAGKILTLESSSIADMTTLCCQNLTAVLKAANTDISKVVKVNVFLTSMDYFAEMNAVYETFFKHKPARSCVAVYQLPKGVPVEIECIALA